MQAFLAALNENKKNKGKFQIIGIRCNCYNKALNVQEEFSFFYSFSNILFQIDNIVRTPNYDFDFIKEYKIYRVKELYENADYIEIDSFEEDLSLNMEKTFFYENFKDNIELFNKTSLNLMYPYRRYSMEQYYLENAENFEKLGLKGFAEHFYDILEEKFPEDKSFLRKRYVDMLQNQDFDGALEKLLKVFSLNQADDFDYINAGYIFKIKEDFKNSCKYYSLVDLSIKQPEYFYNDYIFVLEMLCDEENIERLRVIKEKFY